MPRVAALVAVLIFVTATPAIAVEPLDEPGPLGTHALTSDLTAAGHRNGRLPDAALTEVPAGANEQCLLETEAAEAWELLVLAAEADGVSGFAAGWCYRSLAQQQRTLDRNCPWVTPTNSRGEPTRAPRRVCSVPTARPGTSNHGWGRAVDIVDTTGPKPVVLGCDDPQLAWLMTNAGRYGWVLPQWARCGADREEPWHFEWAGTVTPAAQVIAGDGVASGGKLPG